MINQISSSHTEMVNLESYDSEGPHTPETDDSAEVSALIVMYILSCNDQKVCIGS